MFRCSSVPLFLVLLIARKKAYEFEKTYLLRTNQKPVFNKKYGIKEDMNLLLNLFGCVLLDVLFQCNIPNFLVKFGSSLRSSKVHFRIRKPVCKEIETSQKGRLKLKKVNFN